MRESAAFYGGVIDESGAAWTLKTVPAYKDLEYHDIFFFGD